MNFDVALKEVLFVFLVVNMIDPSYIVWDGEAKILCRCF